MPHSAPRTVLLAVLGAALTLPAAAQAITGSRVGPLPPLGGEQRTDPQDVVYVDAAATGADDGTSWQDAFVELQSALAAASHGQALWVAAGTYKPAPPGGPSSASFSIPSGVQVYGGFGGWETALGQRDPQLNPTILSGDLLGDDTYTPVFNVGSGDNAWQVVTLDGTAASTRLDGFEIIAGHFQGAPWTHASGAGISVRNGAGTIASTQISWCVASRGGGLYASASDVMVEGCDFHHDYASTSGLAGGALANDAGSSVTIRDSSFADNLADGLSGGVAGGALANDGGASMTVERCSFHRNEARNRLPGMVDIARGGAIYNSFGGTLLVRESVFVSNVSNSGGALFGWSTASTALVNNLFSGNRVTKYVLSGGGIEGGGDGGTVVGGDGLSMVGCLVYGGTADNIGGVSAGAGLISSCIFWGNQDGKGSLGISQVKADEVRYSCVENMLVGEPGEDPPDPEKFPGCTDADPLLVDPLGGDFRLGPGSPAIDAAENPAWPAWATVDLDGEARFVDDPATPDTGVGPGPIADMGPYEHGSSAALASVRPEPPHARRGLRVLPSGARGLRVEVEAGRELAGARYAFALRSGRGFRARATGALDGEGCARFEVALSGPAPGGLAARPVLGGLVLFTPSGRRLLTSGPLSVR